MVFQMNPKAEGPTILESSQVDPLIDGSTEEPDVLTSLEMLYENSRDKAFDTLFWSIAAGLKLYDQAKNQRAESKEFKGDFCKASGNRRIKTGCLNPGFRTAYGKLAPGSVSETDLVGGRYDDPLKDVTYAVFRVGMKKTKLDPTFNFG